MEDASIVTALVSAVIVLTKVIEILWRKHSEKNGDLPIARLSENESRQIRETHEKFLQLEKDVYVIKADSDRMAEALIKISDCMLKVSESTQKVAELVDKIDRRQELEEEIRKRYGYNGKDYAIGD